MSVQVGTPPLSLDVSVRIVEPRSVERAWLGEAVDGAPRVRQPDDDERRQKRALRGQARTSSGRVEIGGLGTQASIASGPFYRVLGRSRPPMDASITSTMCITGRAWAAVCEERICSMHPGFDVTTTSALVAARC